MKKLLLILSLIIILISLIGQGCQKQEGISPAPDTTAKTETPTDKSVGEIEGGISDISIIDQELNISELDNLEKDLGEINW